MCSCYWAVGAVPQWVLTATLRDASGEDFVDVGAVDVVGCYVFKSCWAGIFQFEGTHKEGGHLCSCYWAVGAVPQWVLATALSDAGSQYPVDVCAVGVVGCDIGELCWVAIFQREGTH